MARSFSLKQVRPAVSLVSLGALVAATALLALPAGPAAAAPVPAGTKQLNAIACASATNCMAVGISTAIVSTDGGGTWSPSSIPAGTWWAVSCSSATACVAGGADTAGNNAIIDGTTDGGATWNPLFSTPGGQFNGVSCKGSSCVAVGSAFISNASVALVATTSGGAWGAQSAPPGATQLNAVACVDASHCWSGGLAGSDGFVASTSDGGHSWTPQGVAPFSGQAAQQDAVQGLSFPDATHGFLTLNPGGCGGPGLIGCGGGIEATSDGGAHWAVQEQIGNGPTEHHISCPDALNCEVVGGQISGAVIQTTKDGGAHWTEVGGPASGQFDSDVACISDSDCLVVGSTNANTGTVTANAGTGGAPPPPPACSPGPLSPAPTGIVTRFAGADRDGTAVAVSQATFAAAGSAKAVVLASDANYPDALAGTPLAVAKHAPLLLTTPSGLPAAVSAEIGRVAPKGSTVYELGGNERAVGRHRHAGPVPGRHPSAGGRGRPLRDSSGDRRRAREP